MNDDATADFHMLIKSESNVHKRELVAIFSVLEKSDVVKQVNEILAEEFRDDNDHPMGANSFEIVSDAQ